MISPNSPGHQHGRSVADQLRSVDSAEALHAVLARLAQAPDARWTRTQILFYLPDDFHALAEEYFDGERLVIPNRRQLQLVEPELVSVDDIVDRIQRHHGRDTTHEVPKAGPPDFDDPPPLELLTADPARDENDVIGNVLAAILEEARAVDREAPKRYRLTNGRCTGPRGELFVYLFSWSSEPDLLVPGELRVGEQIIGARVGRQADGDRQFELWVDTFLGPTIPQAIFKIDPTFLLRSAFELLKAKRDRFDSGDTLASDLFKKPDEVGANPTGSPAAPALLNIRQQQAVSVAAGAKRSYVWGPPGTGKTTSLGHLIQRLAELGRRVLVLSPYNIAVDEAILSANARGSWEREDLVRIGRISDQVRDKGIDLESLLERRAELSGLLGTARSFHTAVMKEFGQEARPAPATVRRCLEEIGAIIIGASTQRRGASSKKLLEGVRRIREEFRSPEAEIVGQARVVGTTVVLSYLSPTIREQLFDHVIVDEASVLRVPEAVLVALSTAGRLSFFGDPKQLPSIVRHRSELTQRWLKPNPFDLAGIRLPEDARGACVMLTQQHRMAPPIRELISNTFYGGSLEDGNCPSRGRVLVLDTSDTPARTTTKWVKMSASKENLVHRGITSSFITALRAVSPGKSILVLSPYVAQKRAYDREANTNRVLNTRFATVHTSQGTESDIVIVDLVIAPGRGKSRFMNERLTPEFRNLMNVAMSRAREQLILIGHADYIGRTYPDGLLDRLLCHIRERGDWVNVPADLRTSAAFRAIVQ